MPFLTTTEADAGRSLLPGRMPAPEDTAPTPPDAGPAFLAETLPAAFRQGNTIGSALAYQPGRAAEFNPDFDPFDGLEEQYRPFARSFIEASTPAEVERIKRQIDQEQEDRRTLAAAGVPGVAALLAAGLLDPVNLIPIGGAAAARGASLAGRVPTRAWTDLWEGMHARAFVVAGAMKAGLVADLRAAVDKALAEGRTITDFRKDFDAIVQRHGWDYKGARGWRTRTILETNLRTAYAAGKWQQAQATKDRRPYLRYVAILDRRTRPDHRGWHGTVLPIDATWWNTHYPPCGWGCRCTVQTLSDRDLGRYGYSVSEEPEVEWVDRRVTTPEGATSVQVPRGIDPGWAYNPGKAGLGAGEARIAFEKHGPWEALEAPRRPAAPELAPLEAVKPAAKLGPRARPGDADDLRHLWREGVGADTVTLKDPLGDMVMLSPAVVDHMLEEPRRQDGREAVFPLLRELVEHPAEIWVGFARSAVSGRVMLRRRYVRLFDTGKDTGGKDKVVALVADLDGGVWSGLTTMPAHPRYLKALRTGLRLYDEREG